MSQLIKQVGQTPDNKKLLMLGWREWVLLPSLNLPMIKAKVDTGARTCTLHAFEIEEIKVENKLAVRFCIHPKQHNEKEVVACIAEIVDKRYVSDSGGHREERFVIAAPIQLGHTFHRVEITLTNRDSMRFRMLLGRNFLRKGFCVNPGASFLMGLPKKDRE